MEFPALLLALCVIAVAGGAAALLTAHQARHRLGGLTVMAAGPVVGLVALGPGTSGVTPSGTATGTASGTATGTATGTVTGTVTGTAGTSLVPWLLLLAAVVAATAVLPVRVLAAVDAPTGVVVWDATWPVLLGLALAALARAVARRRTLPVLPVPAGDLVVTCERGAALLRQGVVSGGTIGARAVRSVAVTTAGPARWARDRQVLLDRMEAWTTRRSTGAAMAALVTLALLLSLTLPGQ